MANSDLYVMFNRFTGLVKIGISNDVESRRTTLEHACGVSLDLLAVFAGQERHEQPLHVAFTHVRQYGEWFLPTPEIVDLIEGRETPETLLVRMAHRVAENTRAMNQLSDLKRDQQAQERQREKDRLDSVRMEERRIKAEEVEKRAKAKAAREQRESELIDVRREQWNGYETAVQARDALYKTETPDRFAELASARSALVRDSQRARNSAHNGVRVTE